MREKKIAVVSYSGGKGDESPRSFVLEGEKIEVLAIEKMWIEENSADRKRKRFFSLRGSDGYIHTLCHDEESLEWRIRLS
jgi:uncharacterized protein YifE (UPF0438 family)